MSTIMDVLIELLEEGREDMGIAPDDSHTEGQQMQSLEASSAESSNGRDALYMIAEPEGDNLSSGSAWAPNPHSATDSDSEIPVKKITTAPVKSYHKQKRKKQRRPDPILPQHWTRNRAHNKNAELRRLTSIKNGQKKHKNPHRKYLTPNLSHRNNSKHKNNGRMILIDKSELNSLKIQITEMKNMITNLKTVTNNLNGALAAATGFINRNIETGGKSGSENTFGNEHEPIKILNNVELESNDMITIGHRKNTQGGENENIEAGGQSGSVNISRNKHEPINILNVSGDYVESESNDMVPIGGVMNTQEDGNKNIEVGGQSGSENTSGNRHEPIKILNVSGDYVESESNDMVPIGGVMNTQEYGNKNIEVGGQSGSRNTSGNQHEPIKILKVSFGYVQSKSNDMVPIGSGKTSVPKDIYDKINWKSYTMATRKLLMAVFPRRTLATHSLTGKASPAFLTKPAKLCLDPKKVSDIVMTVTANCDVKENLVRSAITTKCADENKMLKQRMQKDQRTRSLEASVLHK